MEIRIVRFKDVQKETWDSWVDYLDESTYLHSSFWINYCHLLLPIENCLSFAVLDSRENILGLCPLGVSDILYQGIRFKEASWNGSPLGAPAIENGFPPQRRRLVRQILGVLHSELKNYGVKRISLRRHPVNRLVANGRVGLSGQFELLSDGYMASPENTIIVDLNLEISTLNKGMTREQRKHISKSQRTGLTVKEFRGSCIGLEAHHDLYRMAHEKSAGGLTRPELSFAYMLDAARSGNASLFVAYNGEIPISYLYCGEHRDFAFGWSQVNVEEYEKEFSPRHLLEWSAVLSYKMRGFEYYEIGTRWYGPQIYNIPTSKELSIAAFKERYGGQLWPDITFEKYYDKTLFKTLVDRSIAEFVNSGYFEN